MDDRSALFESVVLRHLDAAHNLASWLLHNDQDAADAVQDACLKAWRRLDGYRGGDPKTWLLAIVRSTALDRLRARTRRPDPPPESAPEAGPLADLLRIADHQTIGRTLADLPDAHREVLVLRDVEGLTYSQIATVLDAPVGTVMSRLSRARDAFASALRERIPKE